METTKIHRKYGNPRWEYRAICCQVINASNHLTDVIYYENTSKSIIGVEVYTGENYVLGARNRSWSRSYKMDKIPKKYIGLIKELKKIHAITEWSDEDEIDEN
jgi:hypothetical protein